MPSLRSMAFLAAALMLVLSSGFAVAGPRNACDLLPLEEIRGLVGAPVSIYAPELSTPAVRGDVTISTCTYVRWIQPVDATH